MENRHVIMDDLPTRARTLSPIAPWAPLTLALALALTFMPAHLARAQGVDPAPVEGTPVAAPDAAPAPETDKQAKDSESGTIPTVNLLQMLHDGGLLMIPIGACSFVLCVFVFERWVNLRRRRVLPGPFVKRMLEQLKSKQLGRDEALERCEQNGSPVAEVFAAAIRKWGRPAVELEQAIIDAGERVTNGLRRYLRLFNGISTITPLLGLLGTVAGMIQAFNAIASADAMGRPELLASGISKALLTTAAGLTVAIPALAAYLFFASRVDRLIVELDSLGQEVVELIASDGWREERKQRKAS